MYEARKLRRQMSVPEVMLWQQLRRGGLGVKVRRQHPIGPYVVDFYVRERGLVIEIDGEAHNLGDRPKRDEARDAYLKARGCEVLRIAAADVMRNLDDVLDGLARMASPLHQPSAGPPPRTGEDR